jgi:hypothetical protein
MADQQKTQEKKAWHTPEIIVLTRDREDQGMILRSCRTGMFTGDASYFSQCERQNKPQACETGPCSVINIG